MKHVILGFAVASLAAGFAYAAESGQLMMPDADGDGIVTREQMQAHAAQMFTFMDANKDGKLDQADREARRAQMFDRIDTDKNGQISREEFVAAHPMGPDGGMGPGMGHGPGMGQGPGMGMGFHKGGHFDGYHGGPGMMARFADTDKDGAVSKAEFAAAALKHFDEADVNHDGKVTKEERRAAHAARREQWRGRMGGPGDGAPPPPAAP